MPLGRLWANRPCRDIGSRFKIRLLGAASLRAAFPSRQGYVGRCVFRLRVRHRALGAVPLRGAGEWVLADPPTRSSVRQIVAPQLRDFAFAVSLHIAGPATQLCQRHPTPPLRCTTGILVLVDEIRAPLRSLAREFAFAVSIAKVRALGTSHPHPFIKMRARIISITDGAAVSVLSAPWVPPFWLATG